MKTKSPAKTIEIELLAIDLESCTRCVGTLRNIEAAVEELRGTLERGGATVRFTKTVIGSEKEAREREFLSSPTVRVNGRDLALETVESECESCTELCGCDRGTRCRVWRHEGKEYDEAPKALIADAIKRELSGRAKAAPRPPYPGVPENLERFFAGKASKAKECCGAEKKAACCAPSEKSDCCGGEHAPGSCGCR